MAPNVKRQDTDFLTTDHSKSRSARLGEILLRQKTLSTDQLHIALHEQKQTGERLGETLVRLGFIDEDILALSLAMRAGIPQVSLDAYPLDKNLIDKIPKAAARRACVLPLRLSGQTLEIAMADPFDILALDEVRRHFPRHTLIEPRVASRCAIEKILNDPEESYDTLGSILTHIETGFCESDPEPFETYEHPVVQLVDHILNEAIRQDASDIHFEPEDSLVRIRYRIDGVLRQIRALHASHWPALSHRLKIMAGMNIADTRSIQDGRFQLAANGSEVDCRVAIMPSVWGETIVVRLLDHRKSLLPLNKLGYTAKAEKRLKQIFNKPQGLVFVTGPTGSGKTTTLYSVLKQLSQIDVHIATLEEPVEFQLDLIRQTNLQESSNLNFADGVRGLLRMDPDILLIGEVRDNDTAQMAMRAAMTGHQVYSTLHCNDALGALPRLIDLGLSPRVLAGNISGLIAQRLVRKLCRHCATQRRATSEETTLFIQAGLAKPDQQLLLAQAKGCPRCHHTGRKGRTVIAEILPISPSMDDLIATEAPRQTLLAQAQTEGFIGMQEDGLARVLQGEIELGDLARSVDLTRLTSPTRPS